jgi:Na+-driven multidrug efflux pump
MQIKYSKAKEHSRETVIDGIVFISIIIIIITLFINFVQGIYNYIPEANHVSRVYRVAASLYVQFMLHVMFFRP